MVNVVGKSTIPMDPMCKKQIPQLPVLQRAETPPAATPGEQVFTKHFVGTSNGGILTYISCMDVRRM